MAEAPLWEEFSFMTELPAKLEVGVREDPTVPVVVGDRVDGPPAAPELSDGDMVGAPLLLRSEGLIVGGPPAPWEEVLRFALRSLFRRLLVLLSSLAAAAGMHVKT